MVLSLYSTMEVNMSQHFMLWEPTQWKSMGAHWFGHTSFKVCDEFDFFKESTKAQV